MPRHGEVNKGTTMGSRDAAVVEDGGRHVGKIGTFLSAWWVANRNLSAWPLLVGPGKLSARPDQLW